MTSKSNLLYGVQYLRFLAASLVLLIHAFEEVKRAGYSAANSFELGGAGVDIFFVISGFLMCLITEKREKTFASFIKSRLIRVAPSYWAVTCFMALVVIAAPHLFYISRFAPLNFLSSLAFIATPHPVADRAMPLYPPGWTLNYEFFFYMLFACFLWLPLSKKIASVSGILILLSLAGWLAPLPHQSYSFYTTPIMLEFILGMIVAYWYIKAPLKHTPLAMGLVLSSAALFCAGAFLIPIDETLAARWIVWGLPSMLLVAGTIFLETQGKMPQIPALKLLGDASYAVYITHLFAVGAVRQIWKILHLKDTLPDFTLVLSCFVISWVAGLAFHLLFEKNATRFLKKYV